MYGQLTTGKPVKIISRTGEKSPAHYFEVQIDTKKTSRSFWRRSRSSGSATAAPRSPSSWKESTRRAAPPWMSTWS